MNERNNPNPSAASAALHDIHLLTNGAQPGDPGLKHFRLENYQETRPKVERLSGAKTWIVDTLAAGKFDGRKGWRYYLALGIRSMWWSFPRI